MDFFSNKFAHPFIFSSQLYLYIYTYIYMCVCVCVCVCVCFMLYVYVKFLHIVFYFYSFMFWKDFYGGTGNQIKAKYFIFYMKQILLSISFHTSLSKVGGSKPEI